MLKQSLKQTLSQKLSPQQIQLMKLIQLPTQALEERIKEELEENPALEEGATELEEREEDYGDELNAEDNERIEAEDINVDEYLSDDEIPDYRLHANNYSPDDEETRVPVTGGETFHSQLSSQLGMRKISEDEREIAEYLIGNLDEDGYIRRDLEAIVDDLAFTQNIFTDLPTLERLLALIQELDPPGVGARSLQECLVLQLERKRSTPNTSLAISILEDYFDEFTKKHYSRIMDKLGVDEEQLRGAISEVSKLNPKPGNSVALAGQPTEGIVPDYFLTITDGELELQLNSRNAPELTVSREYREMLQHYKASKEKNRSEREAVMFVKQKLDSAKWFVDAVRQRQQTLLVVMSAIMEYQKAYFLSGDERDLKPMILKDIADEVGMDISTVSRVASNKYVSTPYGTVLIKDFFSESMTNDQGEEVSTREIKKILEESIGEENKRKPLTDEQLADLLLKKGYPIARRTVAKYREQLGIPVARLRKEL